MAIKLLNPIVEGITIVEGDKTTPHAVKVLHNIEKNKEENMSEGLLNKAEVKRSKLITL